MSMFCMYALRNKTRFFDKVKNKQNRKKLFFNNLNIITALRNPDIIIICSYNTDLTRDAGN